jgi:hypothetical protein
MTPAQFTSYLQDESYLHQLSYQELQSLVIQYPFCQNFRMLLLKKSQLENHANLDHDLQKAAVYATDRRFLYRTVKRLKNQGIVLEKETETILELTELSNIDNLLNNKALEEIFIEIHPVRVPQEQAVEATAQPLQLENWLERKMPTAESQEFLFEISSLLDSEPTETIEKNVPELVFEATNDYVTHLKSLFEMPSDDNLFENLTAFERGIPFGDDADEMESLWSPIEAELPAIEKTPIVLNERYFEKKIENKIENPFDNSEKIDNQSFEEDELSESNISEDDAIDDLIAQFKTIVAPKKPESTAQDKIEETDMKTKQPKLIARDPVDFNEWMAQYQQNVYNNPPKPTLISNNLDKLAEKRTVVEWSEWSHAKTKNQEKKKEGLPTLPTSVTKSLKRREDIASETLADLLAHQGNIVEAIKMYELLCLENPDKNRFFAQKIQLLQEGLKYKKD